MNKCLFKIPLTLSLLLFFSFGLFAQQTQKSNGNYLAGLDFFGNWGSNTIPHSNPAANGLYAADGWTSGTNNGKTVKMKGLMNAAVLKVDWTTVVGEPLGNYQFVWKSSGQYELQYTNSKGQPKLQTITRSQLEKYPDLLKRFDNLAPSNIDFLIEWRIGDQSDTDREAYLKKYSLMGSIGSNHPHVKVGFKTTLKGEHLLFDPASKQPYNVPYSPAGGWAEFLGLPAAYDKTKLTHIKDYFKICYGQVITNFKAVKVEWNWGELIAIAEKYESYEKGETEPTPKEQVEKEDKKTLLAYTRNDEWNEAYEVENKNYTYKKEYDKILVFNSAGDELYKIEGGSILKWYVAKNQNILIYHNNSSSLIVFDLNKNQILLDAKSLFTESQYCIIAVNEENKGISAGQTRSHNSDGIGFYNYGEHYDKSTKAFDTDKYNIILGFQPQYTNQDTRNYRYWFGITKDSKLETIGNKSDD